MNYQGFGLVNNLQILDPLPIFYCKQDTEVTWMEMVISPSKNKYAFDLKITLLIFEV